MKTYLSKYKANLIAASCYGIAAGIAALPIFSFFWPSIIGVMLVSFFIAPYLQAETRKLMLLKSLCSALMIPAMGLLLGGFFVAVFHVLIQDYTIDFLSHLIAQFVFGVIGYLLVLPLAIAAYFSSQKLINKKVLSDI